jgi:peptidoglycan hydrolase CwlO-like protein
MDKGLNMVSEKERNYYKYRARLDYLRQQCTIFYELQESVKSTLDTLIQTQDILSGNVKLLSESTVEREKIDAELKDISEKKLLFTKKYEQLDNEISELSKEQEQLTKEYKTSEATEREKELLAEIERLKLSIT